jgi:uncharacterized membrane protein
MAKRKNQRQAANHNPQRQLARITPPGPKIEEVIIPPARQERRQSTRMEVSYHQGPIPPPELLAQYNDIIPNGADRIMRMAEEQAKHRQYLEKKVINSDITRSYSGLVAAFFLATGSIGGGVYVTSIGQGIYGVAIFGTTIISLVTTFIYGTNSRKKERDEKDPPEPKNTKGNNPNKKK